MAEQAVAERQEQELVHTSESANIISVIERAAKDPNVDPDKMERMFALYERVEEKKAEQAFWNAFAEMKPELPVITEGGKILNKQGHVQSEYARYDEDIHPVITPILSKHGFSIMHRNVSTDANMVVMQSILAHRGGHKIDTEFPLGADKSGNKNDTQALGSSRSYAKRYNACDLLDLATGGQDDDGSRADLAAIDEEQAADLYALIEEVGADQKRFLAYLAKTGKVKIGSVEEIPAKMYKDAVAALEAKRKK